MENEDICSNCVYWHYSYYSERKYGDGNGRCEVTGEFTFCSHRCPFCKQVGEDEYGK